MLLLRQMQCGLIVVGLLRCLLLRCRLLLLRLSLLLWLLLRLLLRLWWRRGRAHARCSPASGIENLF